MIASSPIAKLLAASGAVALHGAVIWGLSGDAPVSIDGATGAPEVSIGTSFADMAAGVLAPDDVAEALTPTAPAEMAEALQVPEAATPVQPTEALRPERAVAAMVQPEPMARTRASKAEPLRATPLEAQPVVPRLSPSLPVEEVAPLDAPATSVARSLRPKQRSKSFEEAHKPAPAPAKAESKSKSKSKPVKQQAAPKGNASETAKAGAAQGSTQAETRTASAGKTTAKQSGNAAVSNYPGKVMQKISRVRKPRVGSKGTAVVSFKIASNGGLAGLSLARSSGSGALDQAALNVIQKAAPFPPPPKGAQRSFSIKIKGQ
ncbi:TonB family protein [Roseovarius faecimaris]|uniref:TonB family protein n=1 Tax=Roseovarius faecimaris TaxID=2494550 RepID=A0A6I6IQT3_9RHOB|nr:TonB family protein [Roseovarius faecimaris]QGX97596.1 TonB family protein [Roseovarius faecimaris]